MHNLKNIDSKIRFTIYCKKFCKYVLIFMNYKNNLRNISCKLPSYIIIKIVFNFLQNIM